MSKVSNIRRLTEAHGSRGIWGQHGRAQSQLQTAHGEAGTGDPELTPWTGSMRQRESKGEAGDASCSQSSFSMTVITVRKATSPNLHQTVLPTGDKMSKYQSL